MITDTEMLDWLEQQNAKAEYTGRCMFRWSETGRGWRLHEAPAGGAFSSVRDAIEDAMLRARAAQSPAEISYDQASGRGQRSPAETQAQHIAEFGK